jgi:hypothetical protein
MLHFDLGLMEMNGVGSWMNLRKIVMNNFIIGKSIPSSKHASPRFL